MGYPRIQPAVMDEVMCLGPKFYPPSYDNSSYVSYQFLHLLGICTGIEQGNREG